MDAGWITPARAGKTSIDRKNPQKNSDHPRACGENTMTRNSLAKATGSPPRVRGKPRQMEALRFHPRITPARAGKTQEILRSSIASADHPRACGENIGPIFLDAQKKGSPPRVRGKLAYIPRDARRHRITPARAGKTRGSYTPKTLPPDHPRACGENSHSSISRDSARGSPPRVRGKRSLHRSILPAARITPARAGKTLRRRWNRR